MLRARPRAQKTDTVAEALSKSLTVRLLGIAGTHPDTGARAITVDTTALTFSGRRDLRRPRVVRNRTTGDQ
ncbi:hypothetical protein [Streptacidiphilus jiangxiensis]|uniref:Transposase n=1 Tax=Streptacidiphilus jiangxiensis TaxID=235985 RepID=A0A1H7HAC3_STRJI|nr:hypothetical protein [Streptacidiphilus jiangxiensis]SEK47201.1 hypothetical protein SAMN05414137_102133 [Streptacidiphilus jiangxiensis]